jgi:hypothetical protein
MIDYIHGLQMLFYFDWIKIFNYQKDLPELFIVTG